MNPKFHKYQALGNDMLVIDPTIFPIPLTPAIIRLLCDRHFGIGADGICYGPLGGAGGDRPQLLAGEKDAVGDQSQRPTMRFFNPDGSEAGKSGNGLRIFARYVWDQGLVDRQNHHFEIGIGFERIAVTVEDDSAQRLTTDVGRLSFNSRDIPITGPAHEVVAELWEFSDRSLTITAVTVGNPHCIIFADDISPEVTQTLGSILENDTRFPERTNVQFVRVIDPHTIQIEIWERGAGYTLASGTSASATAGAAIRTGQCESPVTVRMAGGMAVVAIDQQWRVQLTGEVEAVAAGEFAADFMAKLAALAEFHQSPSAH